MKPHFFAQLFSMMMLLTASLQNVLIQPGQTEPSVVPEEAQPSDVLPSNTSNKASFKFIAPLSQRRLSGNTSPGIGKDDCPPTAVPLTVLMPSLPNGKSFDVWGQTIQERPLIWVYVPYGSEDKRPNNQKNMFDLQLDIREDAPGKSFVKRKLDLPAKAKIVPIPLPPDYKLEVGKNYQIKVRVTCTKATNPQQADFWVQRVTAPTDLGKVATPSRDRVKLLAERGIWLDTLTEVVKVNAAPKLSAEWQRFVQESLGWDLQESTAMGRAEKVKMEKILKEPIN